MLPVSTVRREYALADERLTDVQSHRLDAEFFEGLSQDGLDVGGFHGMNASCSPRVYFERLAVPTEPLSFCCSNITTLHGLELVEEHVKTQDGIFVGVLPRW